MESIEKRMIVLAKNTNKIQIHKDSTQSCKQVDKTKLQGKVLNINAQNAMPTS